MDTTTLYRIARADTSNADQELLHDSVTLCYCENNAQACNIARLLARTLWEGFRVFVYAPGDSEANPTISFKR